MPRTPVVGVVRNVVMSTKVTPREAKQAEDQAAARGFADRSSYVRWLIRTDASKIEREAGLK